MCFVCLWNIRPSNQWRHRNCLVIKCRRYLSQNVHIQVDASWKKFCMFYKSLDVSRAWNKIDRKVILYKRISFRCILNVRELLPSIPESLETRVRLVITLYLSRNLVVMIYNLTIRCLTCLTSMYTSSHVMRTQSHLTEFSVDFPHMAGSTRKR